VHIGRRAHVRKLGLEARSVGRKRLYMNALGSRERGRDSGRKWFAEGVGEVASDEGAVRVEFPDSRGRLLAFGDLPEAGFS
jgi:hypothetical protein